MRQAALAGQELLQELLATGELRDAVRQIVHAFFEIARCPFRSTQEAVFELGKAAPIPSPRCAKDDRAGDGCPEYAVCDELIHRKTPVGNPDPYGHFHRGFRESRTPSVQPFSLSVGSPAVSKSRNERGLRRRIRTLLGN